MKSRGRFGDKAEASVALAPSPKDGARFRGRFQLEARRPDGSLAWVEDVSNVVTNEGLNKLLDVMFHEVTAIATWYCLLFESDTTPSGATTYATPVFTECTAYDEANRPAFNEAAASSQSITNSANKAQFTISATKTLYGAAIVGGGTDPNTKGDTAGGGVMFCAAKFGSSQAVQDNYVVNLTYTLSAADDGV